ncbi:hypothetical protein D3C79_767790 [compost metagenome]
MKLTRLYVVVLIILVAVNVAVSIDVMKTNKSVREINEERAILLKKQTEQLQRYEELNEALEEQIKEYKKLNNVLSRSVATHE